jgi:serine phosphatase RsbU (regulator of sigma subunit)
VALRAPPPRTKPVAASAPPRRRAAASGIAGDVEEIVRAIPAAVLWALVGTATLALGLGVNAFWQSRRRTALERQRVTLLDDIGLLSSALLPPVPQGLDGLTVSAAYEPAEGPAAGGDFYDVFALDDERLGILLGDVSGHGRASVTHAALARYTLRTLLAAGHGPADALARADGLLVRELPPHFVTVIAAVYDHRTGELAYAKAGHAPPIVLGTPYDGAAERPACPIGLGLGDSWPEFRLQLLEGVTVGLVTDGLEDARTGSERLGRDEVERLLAAQEAPDAAALLGDVRELSDTRPDDTAAVVLTRTAS